MNVGQFGSLLIIDLVDNLTGFDKAWLRITRPDHSEFTRDHTAVNITVLNPGQVTYAFQRGDLTLPGSYQFQVFLENPTDDIGLVSTINTFVVAPILGAAPAPFI